VRELPLIKINNKIPQEEKMDRIQMLFSPRELRTSSKKVQLIQSKKIHTTSHSSTRKMRITKKTRKNLETRAMKTNPPSNREFQRDQES
jgi:hypothetical protein